MILLILFAFLAGIVTILSPCILPVLPLILASSITDQNSRRRPFGIVIGFVLSFTFFTLFLSTLVKLVGIPPDALRNFSIIVIILFGLSLLLPRVQLILEGMFSRVASIMPNYGNKTGFAGGLLIGISLGLLWTPCVGPILASVIALAITGAVTSDAFLITLSYSIGTSIPMFFIMASGRKLFLRVPWLLKNAQNIQKGFGLIMILTGLALYLGIDRSFQSYVLYKFPGYGAGLTKFEDKAFVTNLEIPKGNKAPDLVIGGEWFNSPPLSLSELKGKVILIDFWTYTCINCQRTLPYLRSWNDKYQDAGLVIIGIHAPEFEFEKNPTNVAKAISDFNLEYPIMQDNNFATWRAFQNNYWPAKYLIDKDGNIRYTHFGEGKYDETEAMIQQLLGEAGKKISTKPDNPTYETYGKTPETYLGSKRGGGENYLSFTGKWDTSEEFKTPSAGSKLALDFDAKQVYLVMRNSGKPATVKVYLDGLLIDTITVEADDLYTLVDLPTAGKHKMGLEFMDDNAQLFAFTFG